MAVGVSAAPLPGAGGLKSAADDAATPPLPGAGGHATAVACLRLPDDEGRAEDVGDAAAPHSVAGGCFFAAIQKPIYSENFAHLCSVSGLGVRSRFFCT